MSTIQQAIDTPKQLRSGYERQQAYVYQRWSEPHGCRSCGKTHNVLVCCPKGWADAPDFPDDLVCPNTQRPVVTVVTLYGHCWIAEADKAGAP